MKEINSKYDKNISIWKSWIVGPWIIIPIFFIFLFVYFIITPTFKPKQEENCNASIFIGGGYDAPREPAFVG